MIRLPANKRHGPIGIDVGATSVKMVQFSGDGTQLIDAARWDLPAVDVGDNDDRWADLSNAVSKLRDGHKFRGKEAVVCLSDEDLFIQNVRVSRSADPDMERLLRTEAASRLPYDVSEAEIRYVEADDVRQGDTMLREVILFACRRKRLDQIVKSFERARVRPVAVDVEPCAILRSYVAHYRREDDLSTRAMFVHVGYSRTGVVISEGDDILFVKYVDLGGRLMDEAVARHLKMEVADATALRRHNGDRRTKEQDPEVNRTVAEAIRPVVENLAGELAMCMRYHSVTFRGRPLKRLVLGGGEATESLLQQLSKRLSIDCEMGDPLRTVAPTIPLGRRGQWAVAAGLAMRQTN